MSSANILAKCSNENLDKIGNNYENFWAPPAEEVQQLYKKLAENPQVSFVWKCPGRKSQVEEEQQPEVIEAPPPPKEVDIADDFDFEEESTPVRKIKTPTPKGSAKKKTSSLAGILSNMERCRMIDKMDSSPSTPTTASSTTPAVTTETPKSTPTSSNATSSSTTTVAKSS